MSKVDDAGEEYLTRSSKESGETLEYECRSVQRWLNRSDSGRITRLGATLATFVKTFLNDAQSGLLNGKRRLIQDLRDYERAKGQHGEAKEEFQRLFSRFLTASVDRRGLCVLDGPHGESELGPNWATLDLKTVERTAREAGIASINFEDEYFDVVLCTGLDLISRPASLVSELRRVLTRGGQIWIQVPLNEPFLVEENEALTEYWRITPNGLRILFERFDEIRCSVYLPSGSALRKWSFYYGLKPTSEAEDNVQLEPTALSIAPF